MWMALASCLARQGAAAELAQDAPVLSWALACLVGAEPGMRTLGLLLGGGLVPPPGADMVLVEVALVVQRDQARGGQALLDAPDSGRGQVMNGARQRPATHMISPSRLAVTCRFIPCLRCLPE